MNFLVSVGFNKNEIQNVAMQKLATAPASPVKGQFYYNTTDDKAYYYDGSAWVSMEGGVAAVAWADITDGPSSTPAQVDSAVTNSHTHSNKATLDTYTQTEANLADAVSKKHTQNTDTVLTGSGANVINTTGAGNIADFKVSSTTKASVDANGKFTGTVDWANINSKPSSSAANIDTAVTNSHTHSNKATLDTYDQTNANLTDAVSKKHSQNTDTGTTGQTFQIQSGSSGPKLKNSSGELQVRNSGDTDYADLRVKNITVEGTTTTINSETVEIGDNEILLNRDVATSAANSDGGIAVKRLQSDNSTRADAKLTFNNSTGRWDAVMGAVSATITRTVANKYSVAVGTGSATSIVVTHGLGTRDVTVQVREVASPYAMVMCDVEMTSTDTVTLTFAAAPASGAYQATIIG